MQIELTVDSNTGIPKIKILHLDKDSSIEQIMLGRFCKIAMENGISVINTGGGCGIENYKRYSYENYEIVLNNPRIVPDKPEQTIKE